MKSKLQDYINKISPDTYFTFEGAHYKLHLNSLRDHLTLYNQNASHAEVNISKKVPIEDLYIEHEEDKKQIIIYKENEEFINFGYLNYFKMNRKISREYRDEKET